MLFNSRAKNKKESLRLWGTPFVSEPHKLGRNAWHQGKNGQKKPCSHKQREQGLF